MLIAKPVYRKLFIFFGGADLCKERSTKSNDRAVAAGWKYPHGGDETVPSGSPFLARAGLELAYFSFYSRLMQRRAGGAPRAFSRSNPGKSRRDFSIERSAR
jgi:hypothetical protein